MKTLKENGLKKNTLLIFLSDKGPWLNFGNWGGSTGGLREGKGTTFEGGVREPEIMRWPGTIPAGTVNDKLASTIDILPTLAAVTGAPLPNDKFDGVNILSLLKGKKNANPRNHLFFYYGKDNLDAVRQGHWKLILPHLHRSYENELPGKNGHPGKTHQASIGLSLYNLRRDPGERYNVIVQHPRIEKKMMKLVKQARKDMGDSLTKRPGKNRRPIGKCSPCRYPGLPAGWTPHGEK
jgi:arylsulfatase